MGQVSGPLASLLGPEGTYVALNHVGGGGRFLDDRPSAFGVLVGDWAAEDREGTLEFTSLQGIQGNTQRRKVLALSPC